MSETHLVLPHGAVICKKCEQSGRKAEMSPQSPQAKNGDELRLLGESTDLKRIAARFVRT